MGSQFCFKLYPFIIVEVYVLIYEEASLFIGLKPGSVYALRFQNGKEIFG